MNKNYVFADAQQAQEWERLRAIQAEFDPITHRHLERLGVGSGWSCLEVGPGAGSIMRWLCEHVSASGRVVAVDIDPRFIIASNSPNLEVRRLDIAQTAVEADSFDLVHARFVLMHIRDRESALTNMVRALKPGGWLLLEEPDFSTAMPAGGDTTKAKMVERVLEATRQLYVSMGVEPFLGRQLPSLLQDLNLQAIAAQAELSLAPGKSRRAKIWRMAVEHLKERLLGTGLPTENDLDQFIRLTHEETAWMLDYATVATWGQKRY